MILLDDGFRGGTYKPRVNKASGLYLPAADRLTNPGIKMWIPLCAAQSLTIRAGKQSRQRSELQRRKTTVVQMGVKETTFW